jgi:predicted RNA binding protein YcfA (HicA-like mRNA interferase family)
MHSQKLIQRLLKDGWYLRGIRGSHHIVKHPLQSGLIVIPHPRKDMPIGLLKAILKQADQRGELK